MTKPTAPHATPIDQRDQPLLVKPDGSAISAPTARRKIVSAALLGLFLTSLVAGYITAQAMSPRWDSPIVLRDYVAANVDIACVSRRVMSDAERVFTPHLAFTCEAAT